MSESRGVGDRLVHFPIFVLLTIVTVGLYPFYFRVSRLEEQNVLLGEILAELTSDAGYSDSL